MTPSLRKGAPAPMLDSYKAANRSVAVILLRLQLQAKA